ncbi:MAG: hypothetical protein ACPGJR_10235 [Akkermansiaceae bacterium]
MAKWAEILLSLGCLASISLKRLTSEALMPPYLPNLYLPAATGPAVGDGESSGHSGGNLFDLLGQ